MSLTKVSFSMIDGAVFNVLDFGADSTGATDSTTAIQNAIDVANTNGGIVFCPVGTYKGNWIIKSNVTIRGDGMETTIFTPATNLPVFRTADNVKTEKIFFYDFKILGNLSFANQDGIYLSTTGIGNYVDTICIENVRIVDCGKNGISAAGTAAAGPFVQRLKCTNVDSSYNNLSQLKLTGTVIESMFLHCSFSEARNLTGSGYCCSFEWNGDYPSRILFENSVFSNSIVKAATGTAYGVYIGAASQVTFLNCNFEFVDPAIFTANFVHANGFVATNCNFGFSENTTNAILLNYSTGTIVENCSFRTAATLTNAINLNGDISKFANLIFRNNTITSGVTNYIADANSFYQSIMSGAIKAYRNVIYLVSQTGSTDDLDSIFDYDGTAKNLNPGQIITLKPLGGNTITVKHNTGNLILTGASDYVMGSSDQSSITFVWSGSNTNKWYEIGRT